MEPRGRFTLPSREISKLSGEPGGRITGLVVVTPKQLAMDTDPAFPWLELWLEEDYHASIEALFEANGGYDPIDEEHIEWSSQLYSASKEATIDDKSRIVLTPYHIGYAKLGAEVLIRGNRDHFEIWNPDILAKKQASRSIRSLYKRPAVAGDSGAAVNASLPDPAEHDASHSEGSEQSVV